MLSNTTIKLGVITLFPESFPGPLGISVLGKGLKNSHWKLEVINLKNYSINNRIDDEGFGGGSGMIIRPDLLSNCIDEYINQYECLVFTVPFGMTWQQKYVENLCQYTSILFVCGRYEGIDYRIYDYYSKNYKTHFFSVGDFILCGGEIAAMTMIETIARRYILPEEVVNLESFSMDSKYKHKKNLLEFPQYTRPYTWKGINVPDVLVQGNHRYINKWRREKSIEYTKKYRNDLI